MEAGRMVMSGMWLQDGGLLSSGNSKLLMIFIGIVAFSMLTQAIVFIVAAVAAAKGRNRVLAIVEEIRLKTLPVIDSTHSLIHDLHPKVKVIADNLVETGHIGRGQAQHMATPLSDVDQ